MRQPILYLMLGYPGSGKTTTAKIIHELTGAVHLASDKIRLELFSEPRFTPEEHEVLYRELDRRTEELLARGKDVIYDANLNQYPHRKEKYEISERTGTKTVLIWIKTQRDVSKTRATHTSRSRLWPSGEAADKMFERLADIFEPPLTSEVHVELDGTKITPAYVQKALQL